MSSIKDEVYTDLIREMGNNPTGAIGMGLHALGKAMEVMSEHGVGIEIRGADGGERGRLLEKIPTFETTAHVCVRCGNRFTPIDNGWEWHDYGGTFALSCLECAYANKERCAICIEYKDDNDAIEVGSLFVVNDRLGGAYRTGLYFVTSLPFYSDALLSSTLFDDAITRVCDVTTLNPNLFDFPLTFPCRSCSHELVRVHGLEAW